MAQWYTVDQIWSEYSPIWSASDAEVSHLPSIIQFSRLGPLVSSRQRGFGGIPDKFDRALQKRRSDDTVKNVKVGLQDIDEAILYYFNNVIKPTAIEENEEVNVPVRYGDSELWKSVQKDGYTRDSKGNVIVPLVVFKRTNIERDDGVPIDKADRNIVQQFKIKWSSNNRYDRFSILTNMKKTYDVYNVVMPDYIIVNYDAIIWTSFVTQMNKIVEQIYYSEGQFWGDPEKFKFSSRIDSFDQNIEINTEQGRMVRSNFSIQIRGYLVPEIANDLITTQKAQTKQQIVLNETFVDSFELL